MQFPANELLKSACRWSCSAQRGVGVSRSSVWGGGQTGRRRCVDGLGVPERSRRKPVLNPLLCCMVDGSGRRHGRPSVTLDVLIHASARKKPKSDVSVPISPCCSCLSDLFSTSSLNRKLLRQKSSSLMDVLYI